MVVLCNLGMSRPRTYTSGQIERARKKARKGGWTLKKQTGTAYRAVRAKKPTSTRRRTTGSSRRTSSGRQASRNLQTMRQRARDGYNAAPPNLNFGGKSYVKDSASTTKSAAQTEAQNLRRRGINARVVKRTMGRGSMSRTVYVVYSRSRSRGR